MMEYVFPSDQDRAENRQLDEACTYVEHLLDQQAARAQGGQSVEVASVDLKEFWQKLEAFVDDYVSGYELRGEGDYTPNEKEQFLIEDCVAGLLHELSQEGYFYTHPQPAQQDPDLQLIRERDYWEEKATELAEDVGKLLGVGVGEHSSANCPVQNAIDAVFRATEYPAQQGSVPEGWKLVPIVPTKSMQDAWDIAPTNECADQEFIDAYQAMLDAAPQPPQDGE